MIARFRYKESFEVISKCGSKDTNGCTGHDKVEQRKLGAEWLKTWNRLQVMDMGRSKMVHGRGSQSQSEIAKTLNVTDEQRTIRLPISILCEQIRVSISLAPIYSAKYAISGSGSATRPFLKVLDLAI